MAYKMDITLEFLNKLISPLDQPSAIPVPDALLPFSDDSPRTFADFDVPRPDRLQSDDKKVELEAERRFNGEITNSTLFVKEPSTTVKFRTSRSQVPPEAASDELLMTSCSTEDTDASNDSPPSKSGLHVCEICHMQFPFKSRLSVHLVHHENERLHECPECHKTYNVIGDLNRHRAFHLNQTKKFSCPRCDRTFAWKNKLKKHMLTHEDKSIFFNCRKCSKNFIYEEDLQRHQRNNHVGL